MSLRTLPRAARLSIMLLRWTRHLQLLSRLARPLPVLAWSACAIILGVGAAPPAVRHWGWLWSGAVCAMLLHAITAHALNDIADWHSGTDRLSPGLLSGGSGVLRRGLTVLRLTRWGVYAAIAATCLAIYLAIAVSAWLLLFYAIGLWAAIAYSHFPWRLAYHPLAGEWLAAWPSAFALVAATALLSSGTITATVIAAAVAHATMSVAWLMQHHLPDIDADLRAIPIKLTTPAAAARRWGRRAAVWPGMVYYALALCWGLYAANGINAAFAFTSIAAIIGLLLTAATQPADIRQTSRLELTMIGLAAGHALILAALLA